MEKERMNQIFNLIKDLKTEEKNHLVKSLLNDENKIDNISELLSKFNESEFEKFTSLIISEENVLDGILKNLSSNDIWENSWSMGIIQYKTKSDLVNLVMTELKEILCLSNDEYDYSFKGTKNDLISLIPKNLNKNSIVEFIERNEYNEDFYNPLFNLIYKKSPNWSISFRPFEYDQNNFVIEHLGIEVFEMFHLFLSNYNEYQREIKLGTLLEPINLN